MDPNDPEPEQKAPVSSDDATIFHFKENNLLDESGRVLHLSDKEIDLLQQCIDEGQVQLYMLDPDQSQAAVRFSKPGEQKCQVRLQKVTDASIFKEKEGSPPKKVRPATKESSVEKKIRKDFQEIEDAIQNEQDDPDEDPDWVPEASDHEQEARDKKEDQDEDQDETGHETEVPPQKSPRPPSPRPASPQPSTSKGKGKGKKSKPAKKFKSLTEEELDDLSLATVSPNTGGQTKWAAKKFKGKTTTY